MQGVQDRFQGKKNGWKDRVVRTPEDHARRRERFPRFRGDLPAPQAVPMSRAECSASPGTKVI